MRLKYIREEKELKQEEVAKLLGVSRGTYSMWEIEQDIIPIKRLNDFCNIFDVSIDYVLGGTSKKKYNNSNSDINTNKLKERLKTLRKSASLTQQELSDILKITRSLISKYELNINLILTNNLIAYCNYFHISSDYLLGRINKPNKIKEIPKITL